MTVLNFGAINVVHKKVAIVGYPTSGKSLLVKAFATPLSLNNNVFSNQYEMTIYANVQSKSISLSQEDSMELYLIDLAGHEIYSETVGKFIREDKLDAIIYVIDVTQRESLIQAQSLLKKYRTYVSHAYLVANKIDLTDRRIISTEMGQELAKQFSLAGYFECSSAMRVNVDETFKAIAQDLSSKPL